MPTAAPPAAPASLRAVSDQALLSTSRNHLSSNDVRALLSGDAHAVRITDFLHPSTLAGLQERFLGRDDHGALATDDRFRRIGHAFSETTDEAGRQDYFDHARETTERLRAIAAPFAHPADGVRVLLDEVWPTGAQVLRHHGRPFVAGVARYQLGGVDLEPHTDNVDRNLPEDIDVTVRRQLSVNVYLDVPEQGGELQIWDEYPPESEYRERSAGRTYGVDRATVGEPSLVVRPRAGEAILIDPRRIHAVAPSLDRPRVTIGLFIGVVADDAPLVVWS